MEDRGLKMACEGPFIFWENALFRVIYKIEYARFFMFPEELPPRTQTNFNHWELLEIGNI